MVRKRKIRRLPKRRGRLKRRETKSIASWKRRERP